MFLLLSLRPLCLSALAFMEWRHKELLLCIRAHRCLRCCLIGGVAERVAAANPITSTLGIARRSHVRYPWVITVAVMPPLWFSQVRVMWTFCIVDDIISLLEDTLPVRRRYKNSFWQWALSSCVRCVYRVCRRHQRSAWPKEFTSPQKCKEQRSMVS